MSAYYRLYREIEVTAETEVWRCRDIYDGPDFWPDPDGQVELHRGTYALRVFENGRVVFGLIAR